ncbi:glycosyltransferase [Hymenobacter algoricola]|uniref:Glycosyltransferase n=1 Tax=Hymenobacter algoricola TaxID=486267 RepID=A0ABP7NPB5_9BACT
MVTPDSTKKKILLLTPHLTFGGAERVFHDHGEAFARRGHQVTECLFDQKVIAFPTQNALVSLDVPARPGVPGKLRTFWERVRRTGQIKKATSAQVCISHLEGADYLNLLSKGPERVILCIHNSKRHDPNIRGAVGWLRRTILMPQLYQRADKIVCVSRDLRQELLDTFGLPPEKVVTINNFFDVEGIARKSREALPPAEEELFATRPVLLASGRLGPEKNQLALLPVLAELHRRGQTATRLVLLGDGPVRPQLLARCRELGLRAWQAEDGQPFGPDYDVYFLGFQTNPFRYLARATVSLLPSLTEGFPMALCESMACRVPVASADCPTGPREILAPQTPASQYAAAPEWAEFGLLLPILTPGPGLPAAVSVWADSLSTLLADPELRRRYVAKAHERVQDFAPDRIMQQWEAVL